jgi:predicted nucleotidyltransferase
MQLQSPMKVITPTVDGDVLTVLARAEQQFTIPTLASIIQSRSPEGIRQAMSRLVEQGIVHQQSIGRARVYALNREHLAAAAIVELADLSRILSRRIRAAIESWSEPPVYAALFGSAARGEMLPGSDIDLFILRDRPLTPLWDMQVAQLLEDITKWTGNDAQVFETAVDEARANGHPEPVIDDILRDGVPVFGDTTALRRLAVAR